MTKISLSYSKDYDLKVIILSVGNFQTYITNRRLFIRVIRLLLKQDKIILSCMFPLTHKTRFVNFITSISCNLYE